MKKLVGTVNITPTPKGYANCLIAILENSISTDGKEWAREEIRNAFIAAAQLNPDKWGKEVV